MNYRVLLIISLVIIVLGFGGLFMLPTNEGTTTENVGPRPPRKRVAIHLLRKK